MSGTGWSDAQRAAIAAAEGIRQLNHLTLWDGWAPNGPADAYDVVDQPADLIHVGGTVLYRRRNWSVLRIVGNAEPNELEPCPRFRRKDDACTVRASLDEVQARDAGYRWPKSSPWARRHACTGRPRHWHVRDRKTRSTTAHGLNCEAIRVADLLEGGRRVAGLLREVAIR